MNVRIASRSAFLALLLLPAAVPARAATPAARAQSHYEHAEALLARNTIDTRRLAIAEFEQAALLDPGNPLYELELARAYYLAGFLKNARTRFERVTRMAPAEAGGRLGLGQVWRRDWLKYLDRGSLQRAIENLSWAARLAPADCDAWLLLAPLLVEKGDDRAAASAASRALEAAPSRAEALLASAYTSFRLGAVERAESAFAAAIPRLKRSVRERFEDIAPVASAEDTIKLHRLPPAEQAEFLRRFWKDIDPDLATALNEAQLEYWARVAHAYFIYYQPKRREWDERGEMLVRYGPPDVMDYNPIGVRVPNSLTSTLQSPANVVLFPTGPAYPANFQVWTYHDLGMAVVLQDRLLSEFYMLPITMDYDPDPIPNPDVVAGLGDAFGTASGRGVFHRLPPGTRPLPVEGAIARFQGEQSPRLLAQAEIPAAPGDSLWADWVVLDSTRSEVARVRRPLSPSACDAARLRVSDFAVDLPPGSYLVGLAVSDGRDRRGVFRAGIELPAEPPALQLSDVVVSCGAPGWQGSPVVRPEPNPAARVAGDDPLTAYFEIYHLSPAQDGQARFQYVYTVRSAARDNRTWIKRLLAPRPQIPEVSASRTEENVGPLRRQFVTVPVQSLPPGPYRLEIRVRDLIANAEVARNADFVKVDADAPAN